MAAKAVYMDSHRSSIPEYFFKAGLCHIAVGDHVTTNRALERYRDTNPTFSHSREYQLLMDLLEAVQAGDQEMFVEIQKRYQQTAKPDPRRDNLFTNIRDAIIEQADDFS
jgi:alpha-soluble NSF attachment protein